MPSVTTQNIGAASAQTVPTTSAASNVQRPTQVSAAVQQVAAVTALAADKATISLKTKDHNRSAQVPKKVEGAFRSQEDPQRGSSTGDTPRVSRRRDPGQLDIEA
jgi:hypothetical protein